MNATVTVYNLRLFLLPKLIYNLITKKGKLIFKNERNHIMNENSILFVGRLYINPLAHMTPAKTKLSWLTGKVKKKRNKIYISAASSAASSEELSVLSDWLSSSIVLSDFASSTANFSSVSQSTFCLIVPTYRSKLDNRVSTSFSLSKIACNCSNTGATWALTIASILFESDIL